MAAGPRGAAVHRVSFLSFRALSWVEMRLKLDGFTERLDPTHHTLRVVKLLQLHCPVPGLSIALLDIYGCICSKHLIIHPLDNISLKPTG